MDQEIEDPREAIALLPPVLVVQAADFARFARDWRTSLSDELYRGFIKTDDLIARIDGLRIQIEHVFHSHNEFRVNSWNTPHVSKPRF